MNALERLYLAIGIVLTAIACAHESQAAQPQTVMHIMVYNVATLQPTEHAVVAMPDAETCAKAVIEWDALGNEAGDRTEARCLEVKQEEQL